MFRFADSKDKILIPVGTIAALLLGGVTPCFALLWGDMTDAFGLNYDALVDKTR